MVMIGILPTLRRAHTGRRTTSPPTRATSCSATRSSPPAARTSRIDIRRRRAAADHAPTRSCPRPPAPASSSTSRSPRTTSPTTGTPPRRSPASSSRVGANSPFLFGRRAVARDPDRRCSSRPPTPAPRSSRRRACGRGCGSASAGSPRSSTCSRRTSATSRRCCRSATTRTRSRCSRPAAYPDAGRAAAAQRHDLPLEPAGLRRRRTAARTCGWRTGCCRPARPSST